MESTAPTPSCRNTENGASYLIEDARPEEIQRLFLNNAAHIPSTISTVTYQVLSHPVSLAIEGPAAGVLVALAFQLSSDDLPLTKGLVLGSLAFATLLFLFSCRFAVKERSGALYRIQQLEDKIHNITAGGGHVVSNQYGSGVPNNRLFEATLNNAGSAKIFELGAGGGEGIQPSTNWPTISKKTLGSINKLNLDQFQLSRNQRDNSGMGFFGNQAMEIVESSTHIASSSSEGD